MNVHRLLIQNKILWDTLHVSNIEQYYEYQTKPWSQGGSSDVFLLSDNKVCKRETLFTIPSRTNNDSFYHRGGDSLYYIKESFLLEALVMETLSPVTSIVPKVHLYRFGQLKNGTWVSVIIMEKMEGNTYPPSPAFHMETMKSLWIPFMNTMKSLYHDFSFIHGDLIFRNIKIRKDQLVLFDFGLSSVRIGSQFFFRYHSFRRSMNQLLGDSMMVQEMRYAIPSFDDCHNILHFVQQHRQGVDICALLGRFMDNLSPAIVDLLKSCIGGRTSTLQQTTLTRQPFPMSYSRKKMTYDHVLKLLSTT